tara:strand:- start:598 stop:726 length:129 start_codon:yes stop_codon:yes gene_type:complete
MSVIVVKIFVIELSMTELLISGEFLVEVTLVTIYDAFVKGIS